MVGREGEGACYSVLLASRVFSGNCLSKVPEWDMGAHMLIKRFVLTEMSFATGAGIRPTLLNEWRCGMRDSMFRCFGHFGWPWGGSGAVA